MLLVFLSACRPDPDPGPSHALPIAGTLAFTPASPDTDDLLSVTVTDSYGTLSYAWTVDGAPVGEDAPTLDGAAFAKGQEVQVAVTATLKGEEDTATLATTVVNAPPDTPAVDIQTRAEGYTCSVTTESTDPDGDAVTYTTWWTTDGTEIAGDTLTLEESARGAAWSCWVLPNDGEVDGNVGMASITLEGPVPGGYAFERISDVLMPADLSVLPDDSLLVATLLGDLVHLDPETGETLGTVTLYDSDDFISVALDPRFGDGTHDWIYTWANHTCVLERHTLSLDPFAVTDTINLATMDCPLNGGHAGGDLLWWAGDGEYALYLGIGPTIGGNPQEEVEPGQKLLAFAVDDDGIASPAYDAGFENPYIVALGLRNPWRLADCGDAICIADAGSDFYEEVNRYTGLGMNFGYPRAEGPDDRGVFDDPSIWWENDDPTNALADQDGTGKTRFENVPVVGLVASGRGYAGRLEGLLLYGDTFDAWIRGARFDDTGAVSEDVALADFPYAISMAEDSEGTIYAASLANGVYRMVLRADRTRIGEPGDRLSDAAPGGIPYDVRYPLWSNGADKQRWVEVPEGSTIDTSGDTWAYPDGTRVWKQFSVDGELVETRLIEKRDGVWVPGVYIWDGDDAYLTDGTRQELTLSSGETYTVPSQYACNVCHLATLGREAPIGLEPFQLGDEGLAAVASVLDTPPAAAPQMDFDDPTEAAVRGWLHGNCAFCHQPAGVTGLVTVLNLDFRYDAEATNLETSHAEYWYANPYENDGIELIVPGDPDNSGLVQILEAGDMPPLSVWTPDTEHIDMIREWIAGME